MLENGDRFEKTVITGRAISRGCNVRYRCKCDCGKRLVVLAPSLIQGVVKSCGCSYFDPPTGTGEYHLIMDRIKKERRQNKKDVV